MSDAEPTYSWLSVFVSHPPPSNVLSLSGTKVGSTEVSQGDGVLQQSDATEAFAVMAPIMACWFNVCRTAGVCRSGKASGGGRVVQACWDSPSGVLVQRPPYGRRMSPPPFSRVPYSMRVLVQVLDM